MKYKQTFCRHVVTAHVLLSSMIACQESAQRPCVQSIHRIIRLSQDGDLTRVMNEMEDSSRKQMDTAYVRMLVAYVRARYGDDFEIIDSFRAKGEHGEAFYDIWISSGDRKNRIRFDYVKVGNEWKLSSFAFGELD